MTVQKQNIDNYIKHLAKEERSKATIEKYTREICAFSAWLADADITKEAAVEYKRILGVKRKACSVNAAVSALNGFFVFMNLQIKLKSLKIQTQVLREKEKELTKAEYERLVKKAQSNGDKRLCLVLQTICSTGIRISELCFITLESARSGRTDIKNKGKTRTVFVPEKLQTALTEYAMDIGIKTGSIFVTKKGNPINRSNIWAEMKKLCKAAGVPEVKVFPHNLRRLFAREFYRVDKDVMRLADVLGHSNVNTTRIYLQESGDIHRERINALGLMVA